MQTFSKKILIIDDSSFSRNLLKRALGSRYQFLEAENGLSGIELFINEKPDLVILDLTMPEMSGMEVLQKLRQLDQQAPILIGSADVQSYTQERANALGATGYITKPYAAESLQAAVSSILNAQPGTQDDV